jgi:hypothetical protein
MTIVKPGPWKQWRLRLVKEGIADSGARECVICRRERKTLTATIHAYQEDGQGIPYRKVEVCEDCLK